MTLGYSIDIDESISERILLFEDSPRESASRRELSSSLVLLASKLSSFLKDGMKLTLRFNFINSNINDWVHFNSIDYNASLDQIILSARHLNELYILDHSTTTLEAATHIGGNANRGGDLLWRWGNPQVYKQGTTLDQQLFLQHDAKWVQMGYSDEGKISVFNNEGGGTSTFSSVHLIQPEIIASNYLMSG